MAGCNECKYYKSELGEFLNGKFTMKRNCILKFNDKMLLWWEINKNKTTDMKLTDMDCHDYHDSTKSLIKMNELASELLDLVKIENKK